MTLSKQGRLDAIKDYLKHADAPVSGDELAKLYGVSRQVIVQDISLLRAQDIAILSTNRGYYIEASKGYRRVVKCHHKDDQIADELNLIVDLGAICEDVFVEHRIYGKVTCELKVKSRKDVKNFMENIYNSVSTPLKNITDSYHFHTIFAEEEDTLDEVEEMLKQEGFLVEVL